MKTIREQSSREQSDSETLEAASTEFVKGVDAQMLRHGITLTKGEIDLIGKSFNAGFSAGLAWRDQ